VTAQLSAGDDDACHQLQQVITIDLGGRSTEVAMGCAGRVPQHQMSLPLGCLRASQLLQECLDHSSRPQSGGAGALDALDGGAHASAAHQALQECTQQLASSDAAQQLADILAVMKAEGRDDGSSAGDTWGQASSAGAPLVVATGGTITTVSALLQRLPAYDGSKVQWSTVSREQLLGLAAEMCTGERQERCAAACSAWEVMMAPACSCGCCHAPAIPWQPVGLLPSHKQGMPAQLVICQLHHASPTACLLPALQGYSMLRLADSQQGSIAGRRVLRDARHHAAAAGAAAAGVRG
jgi:exopolyphosphatase/pppGpp-phosphohydrolase